MSRDDINISFQMLFDEMFSVSYHLTTNGRKAVQVYILEAISDTNTENYINFIPRDVVILIEKPGFKIGETMLMV